VKPSDREKVQAMKDNGQPVDSFSRLQATEHGGGGFAIRNDLLPCVDIVQAISGRISVSIFNGPTKYTFISCYAPHAGYPESGKSDFYTKLQEVWDSACAEHIRILAGDFNAKLAKVTWEDNRNFGSHILEAPDQMYENMPEKTRENRDLFMNFVESNNLWVANTHYQKREAQACTYYRIDKIQKLTFGDTRNLAKSISCFGISAGKIGAQMSRLIA